MSQKIAVVDYGSGNMASVLRALTVAAPQATVYFATTPEQVQQADRVVFPGQGAMPDCMRNLEQSGLLQAVLQACRTKPLLGVCVGEQMLFSHSEEGDVPALNFFQGEVVRFKGDVFAHQGGALKVPHMGWSQVEQVQDHPLWAGIADHAYFYFVHSYYVVPSDPQLTMGTTLYGDPFVCAVGRDNVFAVQFHPEKSADQGLRLLQNFAQWSV